MSCRFVFNFDSSLCSDYSIRLKTDRLKLGISLNNMRNYQDRENYANVINDWTYEMPFEIQLTAKELQCKIMHVNPLTFQFVWPNHPTQ